jgi:hypothetical protein
LLDHVGVVWDEACLEISGWKTISPPPFIERESVH